jgi:CheY-like chemotaxis protein
MKMNLMSYPLGLPQLSSRGKPVAMDIDGLLKGLSILLVEDNPDSAELFSFILKIAEAQVVTVALASQALLILENYKPDILLSNIVLPDLDGYSLVKQAYAYEEARGRKIIAVAVTESARDINRSKARLAGFYTYIPKPIEPVTLIIELANLTGRITNHEA